jgi:hypothetical protein
MRHDPLGRLRGVGERVLSRLKPRAPGAPQRAPFSLFAQPGHGDAVREFETKAEEAEAVRTHAQRLGQAPPKPGTFRYREALRKMRAEPMSREDLLETPEGKKLQALRKALEAAHEAAEEAFDAFLGDRPDDPQGRDPVAQAKAMATVKAEPKQAVRLADACDCAHAKGKKRS